MARSKQLETQLAQIRTLQTCSDLSANDRKVLQTIVSGKQPLAITAAMKIIIQHQLKEVLPGAIATFNRCLKNGEKTDPGCQAKWAIANALYQLEQPDTDLFLSGVRHRQPEPVWGGTIDTATKLRSLCALGLVQGHYPAALHELADLLADKEHDAREGAARAIGYSGNPAGIPLLRLKLHIGDSEPTVLSACFDAVLSLSADQTDQVLHYLNQGNDIEQSMAALSLGEAKHAIAFDEIQKQLRKTRSPDVRETFLLAIATLRSEEAIDWLLGLLERGSPQDAKAALIALDIYRQTPDVWSRVTKVAQQRQDLPKI